MTTRAITPDEVHHSAIDKAVRLVRLVASEDFSDMKMEKVNTLIDCHSNHLADEDLKEMTRSASEEEVKPASDNGDEVEERGLNKENL